MTLRQIQSYLSRQFGLPFAPPKVFEHGSTRFIIAEAEREGQPIRVQLPVDSTDEHVKLATGCAVVEYADLSRKIFQPGPKLPVIIEEPEL